MDQKTAYVSSIPPEEREKITGIFPDRSPVSAEYYLGKELVGQRRYHRSGKLINERSFRNGQRHGWEYRWDRPGELLSATPYENGVEHGTAYQWGHSGRLIGTYTMEHGTGIDLWWQEREDGSITLTEVYYMHAGLGHGYVWHFHEPGKLRSEQRWHQGKQHGIERRWRWQRGNLERGYPRYWVQDERVTKRQYLRAMKSDPNLPPFRQEENLPEREFPPEIARHLKCYPLPALP